jgi:transcriptional regulator with XRE-family HTH domain
MRRVDPERLLHDVGRRVAEMRVERGLTQERLAEVLGVSTSWLKRVEAGEENLGLRTMAKLANTLHAPVGAFLAAPCGDGRRRVRTKAGRNAK